MNGSPNEGIFWGLFVQTWDGPGTPSVYYDNGDLATNITNWWVDPPVTVTLDNSVGRQLVEKGFADWSAIPSSSFRATVAGDFASAGLPDITGNNADLVIGTYNGGGVYVIFDADGSVMTDFFGGFPTPPLWFLPGPERFYNGVQRGKTTAFTSCQYQAITAAPGEVVNADIQFERIHGAPVVYNLGYGTGVTDVSGDGSIAVGSYGRGGPVGASV